MVELSPRQSLLEFEQLCTNELACLALRGNIAIEAAQDALLYDDTPDMQHVMVAYQGLAAMAILSSRWAENGPSSELLSKELQTALTEENMRQLRAYYDPSYAATEEDYMQKDSLLEEHAEKQRISREKAQAKQERERAREQKRLEREERAREKELAAEQKRLEKEAKEEQRKAEVAERKAAAIREKEQKIKAAEVKKRRHAQAIENAAHKRSQLLARGELTLENFKDYGNCYGANPDIFFPERGQSTKPAKEACETCPSQPECLEFALVTNQRFGVWGGKSERQRRKMRKERGLTNEPENHDEDDYLQEIAGYALAD